MHRIIISLFIIFFTSFVYAETNLDQWKDSKKTYKELVNEGFEVKSYDTTTIQSNTGLIILLFVTVLQKEKEVFECQEYQTLDRGMKTLDMSIVCKELTKPYQRGIGT